MTEHEKYNFYCCHFTPDIDHKFPLEGSRGFLHRYLRKYSWLSYSWQENGRYCLPCVLFARSIDVRIGKGVLVETAFTHFKKMYEVCDLHAVGEYHKDAIPVCDAFIERMSGKRESVSIQLREGARETIQNNRKKLCSITAMSCVVGRTLFTVVIVIVAQIWKVYKLQAQTMATILLCSTFISQLETLYLGTTFRVALEMPHTHPPISRIS